MRLTENNIPVHRLQQSIGGLTVEDTNEARTSADNQTFIKRANNKHGDISESFVRNYNFVYAQIDKSYTADQNKIRDSAKKV